MFVCASSCINHYVQPFIWLPWDARSHPYVCLYCAKKFFIHNLITESTETRTIFFNEQKVGMLLQKRTDTRGVGISSMRRSIYMYIYLLTTTPTNHTHRFHPLPLATDVIRKCRFSRSLFDNFSCANDHWEVILDLKSAPISKWSLQAAN